MESRLSDCRTISVAIGADPARDAFFQNLLENPPFPPDISLDEQRDIMDTLESMNPPLPDNVSVAQVTLGKGLAAELIVPPGANLKRCIVYAHGGAFVNGRTPSVWRYPVYRMAAAADASLLYVLYRLAPEHPFPAARDDVTAGYEYLLRQDYTPDHIVFAGDSAGVNIALTSLLALRARGQLMPAAFVGVGGWIDLTERSGVETSQPSDPLALPRQLNSAARAYLGDTKSESTDANPLFADLHGLPPMRLLVGGSESLKADTIRFSERACQAGVEVHVEVWEGLLHGWYLFANVLPEAEATYGRIGQMARELTPL